MFSTAMESPSSIALSKYSRARRKLGVTPSPSAYIPPSCPILRRGLLDPWQRLRVVYIHTLAIVVHEADLPLAHSVTPHATDLVHRHRSRVVDRHALAPDVDAANELGRFDVALV